MFEPSHFVRVRAGWSVVSVVGAGRFMLCVAEIFSWFAQKKKKKNRIY
jgi:hypothetical protein